MNIVILSLGGILGTLARFYLGQTLGGIWLVNILGCFILGLIAVPILNSESHMNLSLLVIFGFLGSFSTFTSYIYDAMVLFDKGLYLQAGLNLTIQPILGSIAMIGGYKVGM